MDVIQLDFAIQHITGNSGNDGFMIIERPEGKSFIGEYENYSESIKTKTLYSQNGEYTVEEKVWERSNQVSSSAVATPYIVPISSNNLQTESEFYEQYIEE